MACFILLERATHLNTARFVIIQLVSQSIWLAKYVNNSYGSNRVLLAPHMPFFLCLYQSGEEDVETNTATVASEEYIISETNYRLYAYTDSRLKVRNVHDSWLKDEQLR